MGEFQNRQANLDKSMKAHEYMLNEFILPVPKEIVEWKEKQETGVAIDSSTVSIYAIKKRVELEVHNLIGNELAEAVEGQKKQVKAFREGAFSGETCGASKVATEESQMIERERQVVAKLRVFGKALFDLIQPLRPHGLGETLNCIEDVYDFGGHKDDASFVRGILGWYNGEKNST